MPLVDKLLTATIKFLQKKQKSLRRKKKNKKKKAASARRRLTGGKVKVKRKSASKKAAKKKKCVRKAVKKPVKTLNKKASTAKKRVLIPKRARKLKRRKDVKFKKKTLKKSGPKSELIGTVTHYFSRIEVVVVKLSKVGLCVGDTIQIIGSTTDFAQKVKSLQIESVDVQQAKKGELVGLKVAQKAKEGDKVYLIG